MAIYHKSLHLIYSLQDWLMGPCHVFDGLSRKFTFLMNATRSLRSAEGTSFEMFVASTMCLLSESSFQSQAQDYFDLC